MGACFSPHNCLTSWQYHQQPLWFGATMKITSLLLFALLPITLLAQPQGPDTLWTRTTIFPELRFLNIGEMVPLSSGNLLVSMAPIDTPYVDTGTALLKVDTAGNVVWRRGCGDSLHEFDKTFLCQIAPNRFALAGVTWIIPEDFYDVYVAIVDSEASTISQRLYQWPEDERVAGICSSGDGGFLVVYKAMNLHTGREQVGWMKINEAGDSLWANAFEIPGNRVWASAVAATQDGGYVISGYTDLLGAPTSALLLRLDATGNVQFSRTYSLMTETAAWDVASLSNGDFVICGYTDSLIVTEPTHAFVLRTNATGDSLWTWISLALYGDCVARRIITTDNGGFLVNYTWGSDLIRFGADNEILWRHTYNDFQIPWHFSVGRCLLQDEQGRCLLIGDAATDTSALSPTALGVVRTLPESVESTKLSSARIPQDPHLSAYPNPFNPTTEITFTLLRTTNASLKVFDVLGREVTTLANGTLQSGDHRITFDATALPSGIYFYQLRAGTSTQTKKMLLLK
jgi:hypothetical protein